MTNYRRLMSSYIIIFLCLVSLGSAMGADAKEALVQTSENGLFKVEMTLQGEKLKMGRNTADLFILDKNGMAVKGALITILPLIYRHGESTAVRPRATEKGDGRYVAENIYIEMEGHWELKIKIRKDPLEDTATFDFPEVKRE